MWQHEQQKQQMIRQLCQLRKLTLENAEVHLHTSHPSYKTGDNCRA